MSITFAEIPDSGLRLPDVYVELNDKLASHGLPQTNDKVVLLGQMTSAGTATAGVLKQITSSEDAATAFGRGSILARMAAAALAANPYMAALYALPLADHGSGVAATGSIEVAAASGQAAGTLKLSIAGVLVRVPILATDDDEDIAAAIIAAIALQPDLPVSAAVNGVDAAQVDLTALNDGTLGNSISVSAEDYDGVTLTITAMASGATNPDIQTALDAIFPADVTLIVSAWSDATSLDDLAEHLDSRSDGIEQRPAFGVAMFDGTVSAATTLATGRNAKRLTLAHIEATPSWEPEVAAAYAAIIAGEEDLARPLNSLVLSGVVAPDAADRLTRAEKEVLLANGVTVLDVNADEEVCVRRSISTYTADADGGEDYTLLDIQTLRVADWLRAALRQRFKDKFARFKVAALAHTENTTDPNKIRAEMLDVLYAAEEQLDYLQSVEDLKDFVTVELADGGRVNITIPASVVPGLHIGAIRVDLY